MDADLENNSNHPRFPPLVDVTMSDLIPASWERVHVQLSKRSETGRSGCPDAYTTAPVAAAAASEGQCLVDTCNVIGSICIFDGSNRSQVFMQSMHEEDTSLPLVKSAPQEKECRRKTSQSVAS
jgi:hypothetical protein